MRILLFTVGRKYLEDIKHDLMIAEDKEWSRTTDPELELEWRLTIWGKTWAFSSLRGILKRRLLSL